MNDISVLINPYAERGIIRDPQNFFGRDRELARTFNWLAGMQNISVVGARRIGKSSLLYYISQAGQQRLGEEYTVQYLDLQLMLSANEFYERACELLDAEGGTHLDFKRALKGKRVVLCLDEFEQTIDNQAFGEGFFSILRGLAQTGELALVLATQHTLPELQPNLPTSPFFNIFTTLRLGPLTRTEAIQLVTRPIERAGKSFGEAEVDFILRIAGTHPFRLNIACSLVYEAKLSGQADFTLLRRRFDEEMANGKPDRQSGKGRPLEGRWMGTIWAGALAIVSILITWLSVQGNNAIGLVMSVGLAIVALWLFLIDSLPTLRSRGGSQ